MSGAAIQSTDKGMLMRVANGWIRRLLPAAAGAALLAGCQKAGDGIGLDVAGKPLSFCEMYPEDAACVVVNPCTVDPTGPGCQVDTCLGPAPAPGCSVDVCATNPADPSCPQKVRFSEVYPIFAANYCLQCHANPGTGYAMTGLLLTADSAYANLVNVKSYYQSQNSSYVRVKPGYPDSSILFLKISMNVPKLPSGYNMGTYMPQNRPKIDPTLLETIRKWILDGALP